MNDSFSLSHRAGAEILKVHALLSEYTNKQILRAVQKRIDEGFTTFVVDMSEVHYMNSVGLNLLIIMKEKSRLSGGRIAVANASPRVLQLLDMTKLTPMFLLTRTVEEALQSLADA